MDRMGLNYVVLGRGIKDWKNKYKLLLALNYLRSSSRKYVLSLDSSDVLVLGDVGRVLDYFVECGYRMLFNAEAGLFGAGPIASVWREHQESLYRPPFCHLNSGVWIGEREYVISFLERCCELSVGEMVLSGQLNENFMDSEQVRVHTVFGTSPEAGIDDGCEVFQTILGMELV
jgi:predicted nucleic acid-binding Zn finger protein